MSFMVIIFVAMFFLTMIMAVIDIHMAKTMDRLDNTLNKLEYWQNQFMPQHVNCRSTTKPLEKDDNSGFNGRAWL